MIKEWFKNLFMTMMVVVALTGIMATVFGFLYLIVQCFSPTVSFVMIIVLLLCVTTWITITDKTNKG